MTCIPGSQHEAYAVRYQPMWFRRFSLDPDHAAATFRKLDIVMITCGWAGEILSYGCTGSSDAASRRSAAAADWKDRESRNRNVLAFLQLQSAFPHGVMLLVNSSEYKRAAQASGAMGSPELTAARLGSGCDGIPGRTAGVAPRFCGGVAVAFCAAGGLDGASSGALAGVLDASSFSRLGRRIPGFNEAPLDALERRWDALP
jgi:hypothetical protein